MSQPTKGEIIEKLYDTAQRFEGGEPSGLLIRAADTILKLYSIIAEKDTLIAEREREIERLKSSSILENMTDVSEQSRKLVEKNEQIAALTEECQGLREALDKVGFTKFAPPDCEDCQRHRIIADGALSKKSPSTRRYEKALAVIEAAKKWSEHPDRGLTRHLSEEGAALRDALQSWEAERDEKSM